MYIRKTNYETYSFTFCVTPTPAIIPYGTFPTNELVIFVTNDPSLKLIISRLAIRTHSHHCLIQFIIRIHVLNVLVAIEFEIDSLKCKIAPQVPELLRNNPRPKIKVKFVDPK